MDMYKTINQETGEVMTHSRQQDVINQHLDTLRVSHANIINDYNELDAFNPRQVFNDYIEQAESTINDINSLQGELYTQEGKNAEIRSRLDELTANKEQELTDLVNYYQSKHDNLLNKIDGELNQQDDLSGEEVARIQLRNSELEGEIKGRLYTIDNTRDLEHEFNQLAKQAENDSSLARFLEKHYYLFLDRAKAFDTSEMDIQRAIHRISDKANAVKQAGYSDKEQSLYALKDDLNNKTYSGTAIRRNIEQHREKYVNSYQ